MRVWHVRPSPPPARRAAVRPLPRHSPSGVLEHAVQRRSMDTVRPALRALLHVALARVLTQLLIDRPEVRFRPLRCPSRGVCTRASEIERPSAPPAIRASERCLPCQLPPHPLQAASRPRSVHPFRLALRTRFHRRPLLSTGYCLLSTGGYASAVFPAFAARTSSLILCMCPRPSAFTSHPSSK